MNILKFLTFRDPSVFSFAICLYRTDLVNTFSKTERNRRFYAFHTQTAASYSRMRSHFTDKSLSCVKLATFKDFKQTKDIARK